MFNRCHSQYNQGSGREYLAPPLENLVCRFYAKILIKQRIQYQMKIIFYLKRRTYKLLLIEEVLDINLSENKIILNAKMNDGEVYDISFYLNLNKQNNKISVEKDYDASYLKLPVSKLTIGFNKEYAIERVIKDIEDYVYHHNNEDFYIIMNKETCDELYKNNETSSDAPLIMVYEGHKVLIDNSLGFGKGVFR